jgi:hypothetical protein
MDVLLLLVIIAILVGVFFVAIGKGGELAYEQADHAPLDMGPVSATDVALLRPPTALWGYNMQVTDEALDAIARAMRDRDVEIAHLHRQLADLGQDVPAERSPGFSPKHASENPWSRLWTAGQGKDTAGEDSAGQGSAAGEDTAGEDTAVATEDPAPTASLPPADDTTITEHEGTEDAGETETVTAKEDNAEEQGW